MGADNQEKDGVVDGIQPEALRPDGLERPVPDDDVAGGAEMVVDRTVLRRPPDSQPIDRIAGASLDRIVSIVENALRGVHTPSEGELMDDAINAMETADDAIKIAKRVAGMSYGQEHILVERFKRCNPNPEQVFVFLRETKGRHDHAFNLAKIFYIEMVRDNAVREATARVDSI